MNKAEHGTKDLGVGEIAGCRNVVENRRLHEISRFIFRNLGVAAVEQNLRALLFAKADQRLHALLALRCDHWTHLYVFIKTIADAEFRGSLGDRVAERLLRFADSDCDRDGETTLSRAAEGAVADDLRRHGHVGVRKNHDVILGATLALAALALLARTRVDVARDRSRPNEADGANFRMVDESINHRLTAINQTNDSFGQAGFFQKLIHVAHCQRYALARLENEGVSRGDGIGQIPERNHPRKIKGHNGRGDADGLADHHLVDAAGDVFEIVTLHHHRDAAGHFHVFNCAAHLGYGFGEGLAV